MAYTDTGDPTPISGRSLLTFLFAFSFSLSSFFDVP